MPDKERKIEDYDRVLVVEGYSDLLFYAEVLKFVGKFDYVFIQQLGGKDQSRQNFETLLTPVLLAAKTAIAFVVDADEKPQGTRQSLESLLSRLTGQTVVEGRWTAGKPRIGLLVVPGGDAKGEIETLVWRSWSDDPANAGQGQCVRNYVSCMDAAGFKADSPDKALVGALLAVRHDDDPRLGPGARARVFDLNRPELGPLRSFLSEF